MKKRYKVLGTRRFGDVVRLIISPNEAVQEKQEFNPMSLIGNPGSLQTKMEEMQTNALLAGQPDMITIPYKEWLEFKYNTDDVIWIELKSEFDGD